MNIAMVAMAKTQTKFNNSENSTSIPIYCYDPANTTEEEAFKVRIFNFLI